MTSYPVAANHGVWWLTTVASWSHLHAIPRAVLDPDDEDTVEALCGGPWPVRKALCGCTAEWTMPGMFSRMGLPRCGHCCRKLGVAVGEGVPANETSRKTGGKGEPVRRLIRFPGSDLDSIAGRG